MNAKESKAMKRKKKMEKMEKMWEKRRKRSDGHQTTPVSPFTPTPGPSSSSTATRFSPPGPTMSNSSTPSVTTASSLPDSTPDAIRTARKLALSPEIVGDTDIDSTKFLLVNEAMLMDWAQSIACCQCGGKMNVKVKSAEGMTKIIMAKCKQCKEEKLLHTSGGGSRFLGRYDVHARVVKSTLQFGIGYVGLRAFCAALNMQPLSEKSYYEISAETETRGIDILEKVMENTRTEVHQVLERNGNTGDVKDIRVSCDGSWAKRGFTSQYGFVSVIEMTTGMCVDFVVLSKWCRVCESHSSDNPPEHTCTKNWHGSSPAMEQEGWKMLWERSVEKCKFRYVAVVSDGDSKGFAAVRNLGLYEVTKEECINHVAKRLGTALLQVTKVEKLGGKSKGALTKDKVMRLANYFGKCIKQESNVQDMKRAIFATLRHCQSTDANPQHSACPDGERSWCFYKRAVAKDLPIPKHQDNMTTYLSEKVVAKILPTYLRIATSELLEKCKGDTQNSNESLHNVIWNELPKTKFFSLLRMMYCTYRAVVKFNLGTAAMEAAEENQGVEARIIHEKIDKKRKANALRKAKKKEQAKNKKIRKVQEEEEKIAEEGETYGPGTAPLP